MHLLKTFALHTNCSLGGCAQALAMQSCSVAIHYNSPGSKLAAGTTKNAINARGGDAEVFQADLTKVCNLPNFGGNVLHRHASCSGLSSCYQLQRQNGGD